MDWEILCQRQERGWERAERGAGGGEGEWDKAGWWVFTAS